MEKSAEGNLFDQLKGSVSDAYSSASDYFNSAPVGEALRSSGNFLKDWAVPAGATTLGSGLLAGALTAQGERPGESKRERAARVLRNMLLTSGAVGTAWAGASGVKGLGELINNDVSVADAFKTPKPLSDMNYGEFVNTAVDKVAVPGTVASVLLAAAAPERATGIKNTRLGKNVTDMDVFAGQSRPGLVRNILTAKPWDDFSNSRKWGGRAALGAAGGYAGSLTGEFIKWLLNHPSELETLAGTKM